MGFRVFRPVSMENFALYVEGQRASFERVIWNQGVNSIPTLVGVVPATHGKVPAGINPDTLQEYDNLDEDTFKKRDERDALSKRIEFLEASTVGEDLDRTNLTRDLKKKLISLNDTINKNQSTLDGLRSTLSEQAKEVQHLGWRVIPARTKVVLLFRDDNWGLYPRYVVLFEGELMAPGFSRSPFSRSYQFRAEHITNNLEGVELTALEPASYLDEVLQGLNQEGSNLEAVISGTIIEAFRPNLIQEKLGIAQDEMDVYQFAKGALQIFMEKAEKSPIRSAYPIKALRHYDMLSRIHTPSGDAVKKMSWQKLYSLIMMQTYLSLIPQIGGRMSYLDMIKIVLQLFLHEFHIMANPRKYSNTCVVKPSNIFNPVPACNIIYPIHNTNYSYFESWKNKPTRLIQISQPPNGIGQGDSILRTYYRNIAPAQLNEKFKEWFKVKEARGMEAANQEVELVTEEEKERGIVSSYNELPAFVSAAFDILNQEEPLNWDGKLLPLEGSGANLGSSEQTYGSFGTVSGTKLSDENIKAIFTLKYCHEQLIIMEGRGNVALPVDKQTLLNGVAPGMGATDKRYVPQRIYITPLAYAGNANYKITDGFVWKQLGRHFHIFQEPVNAIPLIIKVKADTARFIRAPQTTLNIVNEKLVGDLKNDALEDTDSRPDIKKLASSVSGGTHGSVIIAVDDKEESFKAAGQMIALICEMAELNPSANVVTITDELGKRMGKAPSDIALKKSVLGYTQTARDNIRKHIDFLYNDYKTKNNQVKEVNDIATAQNTTTGLTPKDPKPIKYDLEFASTPLTKTIPPVTIPTFKPPEVIETSEGLDGVLNDVFHARANQVKKAVEAITKSKPAGIDTEIMAMYLVNRATYGGGLDIVNFRMNEVIRKEYKDPEVKIHTLNSILIIGAVLLEMDRRLREQASQNTVMAEFRITPLNRIVHTLYSMTVALRAGTITGVEDLYNRYVSAKTRGILSDEIDFQKMVKDNVLPQSVVEELKGFVSNYSSNLPDSETARSLRAVFFGEENADTTKYIKTGTDVKKEPEKSPEQVKKEERDSKASSIHEFYTQPLCEYYFYHNRYVANTLNLSMVFHPYLVHGFPGYIIDSSEMKMHLKANVMDVTNIIAESSISTEVQVGFVHRADEEFTRELEKTSMPKNGEDPTSEDAEFYTSVPEMLATRIPFFGGEYSTAINPDTGKRIVSETYEELLGCPELDDTSVYNIIENGVSDWKEVNTGAGYGIGIKRAMQCCRIVGVPKGPLEEAMRQAYVDNPSLVSFNWAGGSFPDTIVMYAYVRDSLGIERDINKILFNPKIRNIVKNHTEIVKQKKGLIG